MSWALDFGRSSLVYMDSGGGARHRGGDSEQKKTGIYMTMYKTRWIS